VLSHSPDQPAGRSTRSAPLPGRWSPTSPPTTPEPLPGLRRTWSPTGWLGCRDAPARPRLPAVGTSWSTATALRGTDTTCCTGCPTASNAPSARPRTENGPGSTPSCGGRARSPPVSRPDPRRFRRRDRRRHPCLRPRRGPCWHGHRCGLLRPLVAPRTCSAFCSPPSPRTNRAGTGRSGQGGLGPAGHRGRAARPGGRRDRRG
jgi:hypothetical protein